MGKTDADFNKQAIITADETDNLSRELSMMSSQGGYKISLIWLPERMNLTSANKILKLLEEPPHQTLFLLVSEQPELLLETIRSRAQRIDLKKIETSEVEKALIERRALDTESAHRIARIANGNWNHALEELDSGNENRQHLDMFIMLMRLSYMRNIHDLKKWSEVVATFGREKQKRMLDYFMHMLRESFMYNFRQPELSYMTQEEENFARNFARFINLIIRDEGEMTGIAGYHYTIQNGKCQKNAQGEPSFFFLDLENIEYLFHIFLFLSLSSFERNLLLVFLFRVLKILLFLQEESY